MCLTKSSTSNQLVREGNDILPAQHAKRLEYWKSRRTLPTSSALVRSSLKIREPSWTAPRSSYSNQKERRRGVKESACASPNLSRAIWNLRCGPGANAIGHHVHCSRHQIV